MTLPVLYLALTICVRVSYSGVDPVWPRAFPGDPLVPSNHRGLTGRDASFRLLAGTDVDVTRPVF